MSLERNDAKKITSPEESTDEIGPSAGSGLMIPQHLRDRVVRWKEALQQAEEVKEAHIRNQEEKAGALRREISRTEERGRAIDGEIVQLREQITQLEVEKTQGASKIFSLRKSLRSGFSYFDSASDNIDRDARGELIKTFLHSDDLDEAFAAVGLIRLSSMISLPRPEDTIDVVFERAEQIATNMKQNYEALSAAAGEPFVAWTDSSFEATTGRVDQVERARGMRSDAVLKLLAPLGKPFREGVPAVISESASTYEVDPYGVVLGTSEKVDQLFDKPNPFGGTPQVVAVGRAASMRFGELLTKYTNKAFKDPRETRRYNILPSTGTQKVMDMVSTEAIGKL